MRVKIIKHMSVPFDGYDYTPADGAFELPDDVAQILVDSGTCAAADSPEGESTEAHELLALLPENKAYELCEALDVGGFTTAQSVLNASMEDLVSLRGIGEKTAEVLHDAAQAFVDSEE